MTRVVAPRGPREGPGQLGGRELVVRQPRESRQQREAHGAALLHVELRGHHVAAGHQRGELGAVLGDARDVLGARRHGEVRVDEVHVGTGRRQVPDEGVRRDRADGVPPHVRHAQLAPGELADVAGQPPQAPDVALVAVLEEHLQADADPEEGHALALHALPEVLDPAALGERRHRDVGRTHAGQHVAAYPRALLRRRDEPGVDPQMVQREEHALRVAGLVVDDADRPTHPPTVTAGQRRPRSQPWLATTAAIGGRTMATSDMPTAIGTE